MASANGHHPDVNNIIESSVPPPLENQFFYEDEVYCIDKKGMVKFGLVMENFEAAVSDNEDDCDDVLRKGEIRVTWHPDGKEEILSEKNVGLADRTLMPGDVVRRLIPGKETQRGYCRDILVQADARILGTKYVIKSVSADRLRPLNSMPSDNAVCFDSWVGSTKNVNEKLVLKSTCGSVLEMRTDMEYWPLKDQNELRTHGGYYLFNIFYPGQTLVGPVSSLESAKWITTSHEMRVCRKHKTVDRKFVVQSVEIEGVWVHWQCKALSENASAPLNQEDIQQPRCYITGEDLPKLKRLNLFESCMLQINDKNYLKIEEGDSIVKKSTWRKEKSNRFSALQTNTKISKLKSARREKSCGIGAATKPPLPATQCDKKSNGIECDNSNLLKNCDNKVADKSATSILPTPPVLLTTDAPTSPSNETTTTNALHNIVTKAIIQPHRNTNKLLVSGGGGAPDDWQTDEESSKSESGTTRSSCSSPTPKSSPKRSPLLSKKIKRLKKRSTKSGGSLQIDKIPSPGDDVITEALVVYSTATVVWQDGTIEAGIPSTQLYPIHHLDDHEFFPGDFVLAGVTDEQDISHRDYGVIQRVDHQGRTATVKMFRTYTCADEPRPQFLSESEVSVYDLKDHPDFQYRPGTIVIRVANFQGDDAVCTAGQVMDNYPEGKVKVWWVDGHNSLCWPQDLFEVGQYDADNNFWGNGESDDSWETESEISEPGGGGGSIQKSISKPHLAVNLERARVAMARLEEIFSIKPNLQNQDVMKKLLGVYKKCRYLDRLMNTSFFHEDNFMGLLERVRKGGNATTAERVQDQMNRLFHESEPVKKLSTTSSSSSSSTTARTSGNSNADSSFRLTVNTTPRRKNPDSIAESPMNVDRSKMSTPKMENTKNLSLEHLNLSTSSDISSIGETTPASYQNKLLNFVMTNIDKVAANVNEKTSTLGAGDLIEINDSGVSSTKTSETYDLPSTTSNGSSSSATGLQTGGCPVPTTGVGASSSSSLYSSDRQNTSNCSIRLTDEAPEFVCAKLCTLIKGQLVKALHEINQRFGESLSLSEIGVEEYDAVGENEEDDDVIGGDENEPGKKDGRSENLCLERQDTVTPSAAMDSSVDDIESVGSTPVITPVPLECFLVLDAAPNTHKFHLTMFQPANPQKFFKAVRREHKLLRTALPPGVWVRLFEDRMDLLSVMIGGPKNTPYEDGMFLFDIQLGSDYPVTPPMCHYISYCSDRLNPNLYEDGKVCVSLLGTWSGRGTEVWSPTSTLLQVIVSIQGLILVSEPYFNEAGYEKQKGTQQGKENSRMYNEMVILKMLQSMTKLISSPPEIFREQILRHFRERGKEMYARIRNWMILSNAHNNGEEPIVRSSQTPPEPEFPLIPASRGFCLTLTGLLENYNKKLESICE